MASSVVTRSPFVIRALWLVAAALATAILTIRTHGVLSTGELTAQGARPDAASSFYRPVTAPVRLYALDSLSTRYQPPSRLDPKLPLTFAAGTVVTIVGWAFDAAANAPYAAIGARIDQRPEISSAVIRLPRPDVATALAMPKAQDSGFILDITTAALPAGRHTISIRALPPDGSGAQTIGTPIAFNVRSELTSQRTDSIDALNGVVLATAAPPAAPVTVLRSYRRLTIYGWGFVTSGKRLASTAAILVDGNPAASATYGIPRSDVANAYHDIRLTKSGFSGTLATESLPLGIHEIRVRLASSDGSTVESFSSVRINLQ